MRVSDLAAVATVVDIGRHQPKLILATLPLRHVAFLDKPRKKHQTTTLSTIFWRYFLLFFLWASLRAFDIGRNSGSCLSLKTSHFDWSGK